MQIAPEDIKFLSESYFDPIGRVFFAKGRVFRAIESEYVQQTLDFLKSPLFEELQRRRWVVKTWESHDVQIDGYDLILEHERVKCISPSIWTFSQLKDALLFNMQIDELCQQYGSRLRDARYSNITFVNGKPIFVDFGSFIGDLECYLDKDFALLVYPPLFLYSKREFMLSRMWLENALNYYRAKQIAPQSVLEDSILFIKILSNRVKYYDVYVRQKYPHLMVHTKCGMCLVKLVNKIARRLFLKDTRWRLFKYEAVFKKSSMKLVEDVLPPYNDNDSFEYFVEPLNIERLQNDLLEVNARSVLMYGNFDHNDIIALGKMYEGNIIVATNDYIYADYIYRMLKVEDININVVCFNLLTESSIDILKELTVDVIAINKRILDLSDTTANSAYKFVMRCHELCRYLYVENCAIISNLYSKGFKNLYEKTIHKNIWKSI